MCHFSCQSRVYNVYRPRGSGANVKDLIALPAVSVPLSGLLQQQFSEGRLRSERLVLGVFGPDFELRSALSFPAAKDHGGRALSGCGARVTAGRCAPHCGAWHSSGDPDWCAAITARRVTRAYHPSARDNSSGPHLSAHLPWRPGRVRGYRTRAGVTPHQTGRAGGRGQARSSRWPNCCSAVAWQCRALSPWKALQSD